MKRGGPLKRTTPLCNKAWMGRACSGKPGTAKRKGPARSDSAAERATRKLVAQRSGGLCELRLTGCLGRAHSVHHRRKRSQRGPWSASNCLHTCGDGSRGCHGVVTNTRIEYYSNGWIVRSTEDWASAPILMHSVHGHTWVLLDDEGGATLAPFPPSDRRDPDELPWPPEPAA